MSFDRAELAEAVTAYGFVARLVVAAVSGSVPRNTGTSMLVWKDGQSGTIGGGTLEYEAVEQARETLGKDWMRHFPLGPALGQCCGGAVTLISETYDHNRLNTIEEDFVVRRVTGNAGMPLKLRDTLRAARNSGRLIAPIWEDGWMLEPVSKPQRQLWIFGAGHVGRALVQVLAPLPQLHITWVDTAENRFPLDIPTGVTKLIAANPAAVVQYAPHTAEHLVLTYSHNLDLEICHQLLSHGFSQAGLIGSKTKWARFRKRLDELGHDHAQILRIRCPIGQPQLGKHPQAIAVGVAASLLSQLGSAAELENKVG